MNRLADILGTDAFPAEMLDAVQEAFDARISEAKQQAEATIREEMAARFEHDKSALIEAMDRSLTDIARKAEEEKLESVKKLRESKQRLDRAITENKTLYRDRMRANLEKSNVFIAEQLAKNIKNLSESARSFKSNKQRINENFETVKTRMVELQSKRLQKIDEFVTRQVSRELGELKQDRDLLDQTRVNLIKESKQRLKDTQQAFVRESAQRVERMVDTNLRREMRQLHEDIEANRQNQFGRKIFEAVAGEYMTSYLAENSQMRELQTMLEGARKELEQTKQRLDESVRRSQVELRRSKLNEDRANRTKVMNSLLSGLKGERRSVMETMLENVRTDNLRTAFDRYLPTVLNEGTAPKGRSLLNERNITGDRKRAITENVQESENDAEMNAILYLAGISK